MQMRRVGIAGIAEQSQHLASADPVPLLHSERAWLQMGVEGIAPLTHIDHQMIAGRHLDRRVRRQLAGHLLRRTVFEADDRAIGHRVDRSAEEPVARKLVDGT
jgi:hypothetical protein